MFKLERGGCAAWPVLRAKRDAFWKSRARPAAPYTWEVAKAGDGADDRGVRVKAERGHRRSASGGKVRGVVSSTKDVAPVLREDDKVEFPRDN